MKDADIVCIAGWVVRRGLADVAEENLLREFCEKCRAASLEISRVLAFIDTLHPRPRRPRLPLARRRLGRNGDGRWATLKGKAMAGQSP